MSNFCWNERYFYWRMLNYWLVEKTIMLNIDCRAGTIFLWLFLTLSYSQVPREQCSPVTKQVEREVCQVSAQLFWLDWKCPHHNIFSAAQEVPRSECQDVPSQVPKQVEKNVCKDIPRQVRPVNQSIRGTASYLIREGVNLNHSLVQTFLNI